MSLLHSLMRFKNEGRIVRFDMLQPQKAQITLPNGRVLTVYMSEEYIIGEAEVHEALQTPEAEFMIYNNWDKLTAGAETEGRRRRLSIMKFGAFGYKLDELGAKN